MLRGRCQFNARGKCPVFKLDPAIADAVLDYRRKEQVAMADFIAHGVATVPFRVGDGGMNPVFEPKLAGHGAFDNDGHVIQVASGTPVPGALPRTPTGWPPRLLRAAHGDGERADAGVGAASQGRRGAARETENDHRPAGKSVRRLEDASPAGRAGRGPARRLARQQDRSGGKAETFSPGADRRRAASQGAGSRATEGGGSASPSSKPARPPSSPPAPELRTAYSSPPASSNGLLQGAQPAVPSGSFESRWTALR